MNKKAFRQRRNQLRHGLTIMEVMISIGVILIGLVGVAALIPVASEDASSAIRTDNAVRYASSIHAQLQAQRVNNLGQFIRTDFDPTNDDGYSPGGNTQSPQKFLLPGGTPVPGAPNFLNLGPSMQTPYVTWFFNINGVPPTSPTNQASFCLDPRLLSRFQNSVATAPGNPDARTAYDSTRFPYYNEYYNGLTRPHTDEGSFGSGFPFPRMWRIAWPGQTPPGSIQRIFESALVADSRAYSYDDLEFIEAEDPLDPVGQTIQIQSYSTPGDATSGISSLGARQAGNRYSWIATFVPNSLGSNRYRMSVVVIENRSIADAPGSADQNPATLAGVTSAKNNYEAERVAWVNDLVQLGSVIEVEISASDWTSDRLRANQWVMLSGQFGVPGPQATPNAAVGLIPPVHHWYRVIGVSDPVRGNLDDADPSNDFWTRTVTLDGPAWPFVSGAALPPPAFGSTFMTIVDGAVAVIEDEITVQF